MGLKPQIKLINKVCYVYNLLNILWNSNVNVKLRNSVIKLVVKVPELINGLSNVINLKLNDKTKTN